jgi:hypothetical protein
MRELLFRGQTRRKGEKILNMRGDPAPSKWVYGGVFQGAGDFSVMYSAHPVEKHVVYTDTIGQYIGQQDRNGTNLFEGDIVSYKDGEAIGKIEYSEGESMYMVQFDSWCTDFDHIYGKELEVVGNIYDTPELLGKFEKNNPENLPL